MDTSDDRMVVLPSCSRSPNRMPGVASFARAWRDRLDESNVATHKLYLTSAGSINDTGIEGSFRAPSLSPYNAQFRESLEPGIAQLVFALIEVGCITYTSCEGHLLDGSIHEAHVGVLNQPDLGLQPSPWVGDTCMAHGMTLYRCRLSDSESEEIYETLEFYVPCPRDISFPQYRTLVEVTISRVCRELTRARP